MTRTSRRPWVLPPLLLAALASPVAADHAPRHSTSSPVSDGPLDVLKVLGHSEEGSGSGPPFLHPDVAFVPSTEVRDPNTVVARFDVADGYDLHSDAAAGSGAWRSSPEACRITTHAP